MKWHIGFLGLLLILAVGCSSGESSPPEKMDGFEKEAREEVTQDIQEEELPGEGEETKEEVIPEVTGEEVIEEYRADEMVGEVEETTEVEDTVEDQEVTIPKFSVKGKVWLYTPAMPSGPFYSFEPVGNAPVILHAWYGSEEHTEKTTTANKDCGMWWNNKTFECGDFSFDVAKEGLDGFYLETQGTTNGVIGSISKHFEPGDTYTYLLHVQEGLISLAEKSWNITWDKKTKGLVIGLIPTSLDPQADPPIQEFVGDATVTLDPLPDNKDFQIIYLDSSNPANTSRKSTDPNQSLFFMVNVPVLGDIGTAMGAPQTYTLTVNHEQYSFKPVKFHVLAGQITYLLILPEPKK